MALLRDVPFTEYGGNALAAEAAQDLAQYADQKAPTTVAQLFRDTRIGGVGAGPYISQFLLRPVPFASWTIDPRMRTVLPVTSPNGTLPAASLGGKDYAIKFSDWLSVQNGCRQPRDLFDSTPRFIRNGRDMGQFVHTDVSYEEYLAAALILSTMSDIDPPPPNGATANPPCNDRNAFPPEIKGGGVFVNALLDDCNPYKNAKVQMGFATLGFPDLFSLIAEVARRAFKAVWYQKWSVHRRLRPEEFAGRIDVQLRKGRDYPFHAGNFQKLQNGAGGNPSVLQRVKDHNTALGEASYLLPQAFPEGCPLHPAYGSGHATVAGACVTILKAWFNDLMKLSDIRAMDGTPLFVPVVPKFDADPQKNGTQLEVYGGADANQLTVGGELNKLATNVAVGRNIAGVHWRTDQFEAMRLGEAIAIWLLCDIRKTYRERAAFSLTTFTGRRIVIDRDDDDCFNLLPPGDVSPCPGIV